MFSDSGRTGRSEEKVMEIFNALESNDAKYVEDAKRKFKESFGISKYLKHGHYLILKFKKNKWLPYGGVEYEVLY